jgi:hypothetical protein
MEDQAAQEGENRKIKEESFIEKYSPKEYSQKNYLICTYRYSVLEKVLAKYLFQSVCVEYSLYEQILNLFKDEEAKNRFIAFLQFFIEKFSGENPLSFYHQISKEILKLFDIKDIRDVQFDEYIIKFEFLLAWHFESNFYPKTRIFEIFDSVNDNLNLHNGITNYIYSIESLNTIEHFLKVFEKQNLCSKIKGDLLLVNNLFCTEKVYFCSCNNKNETNGNIIKYLLEQLNVKMSKNKHNKIYSKEIENYIMVNLYFVDRIIQNYSFYLDKDPELADIFKCLEVFKAWPCPISNFCNRIMENIINENSFQGISLFNKLRQIYYLDLMDNDATVIDVKLFKYTLVIYSKEWEKRHEDDQSNFFDIIKFVNYLRKKPKSNKNNKLILKEVLIKLLITFIYNSNLQYEDKTFSKVYQIYMKNFEDIYDDHNTEIENDKVKASLDKLIKILDVGFDKPIYDFNKEINIVAKQIVSTINSRNDVEPLDDNIMDNDFYLPINTMRNYLKPNYTEFKVLYKEDLEDKDSKDIVNIFQTYVNTFKDVVNRYFKYFLVSSKDEFVEKNLVTMRRNFFKTFRINILLFEEENTVNDLIENIQNRMLKLAQTEIDDNDFHYFWKYFVKDRKEIIPKFLLHLVPYYERPTSNPFRLLTEESSLKTKENYLSEFIANNDYLYKTLIFMPFASTCDTHLNNFISKAPERSTDFMQQPPLKMLFSPLKKCLDYYLGDSSGLFNLDLYKITINDGLIEKVFFKNIEILDVVTDSYKHTKLTLTCVDYLGIEHKKIKEINIGNSAFDIKLFNLFYKNNVPFNYKMTSNNGWLEMFVDDKYDFEQTDKFCSFQSFLRLNKEGKYYEEANLPQVELESRFQNYKVKSLLMETNSPTIIIRRDDYMDIDYSDKIDLGVNPKNNTELKLKIKVEPYFVNDQPYSIPIATFTTI